MVVDRIIVDFPASAAPRQDVTVMNPEEEPLYLQVEVLEVSNPGTDQEKREVVKDPQSIGFIATPARLTIPAGSRRSVRLVNLEGHGEVERVYRVNLKPVAAPFEAETSVIRVLVGYQLLVFIAPKEVRQSVTARREGRTLWLENTGNVNVWLYDGEQCQQECVSIKGTRLYPGNRVSMELPFDAPVAFSTEYGEIRDRLVTQ